MQKLIILKHYLKNGPIIPRDFGTKLYSVEEELEDRETDDLDELEGNAFLIGIETSVEIVLLFLFILLFVIETSIIFELYFFKAIGTILCI